MQVARVCCNNNMTLKKKYGIVRVYNIIYCIHIRIKVFYYAPGRHTVIVRGRRAGRRRGRRSREPKRIFDCFWIFFPPQRAFEARRRANKKKPVFDGRLFCILSFCSYNTRHVSLSLSLSSVFIYIYNMSEWWKINILYAHHIYIICIDGCAKRVGCPNLGMTETSTLYTFI